MRASLHAARNEISPPQRGFPLGCQGSKWPGAGDGFFVPAAGHDLDGVGQRLCSIAWLAWRRAASCCYLDLSCGLTARRTGAVKVGGRIVFARLRRARPCLSSGAWGAGEGRADHARAAERDP
jgi:hypothetical protein